MEANNYLVDNPFFSVCIPQHNRTSFIIESCRSLKNQTFKNFEVCISDDCSTDGREEELINYLKQSKLSFSYYKQKENLKYDANLRASINLARGKYCFLLGNDDCLNSPDILAGLYADISRLMPADVIITNYKKYTDGKEFRRVNKTGMIGSGPGIAASSFRKFSFVSGVILDASKSRKHATSRWDGSEMYQTFIACRIIAEGGNLCGIDRYCVLQGIKIDGESVDSYASKPKSNRRDITEINIPLNIYGRLVIDSIKPHIKPSEARKTNEYIMSQILFFTYPFWVFEYRRVQSWKYAVGICLGMKPGNILADVDLSFWQITKIRIIYGLVSLIALSVPTRIFIFFYPMLYKLAKRNFG